MLVSYATDKLCHGVVVKETSELNHTIRIWKKRSLEYWKKAARVLLKFWF